MRERAKVEIGRGATQRRTERIETRFGADGAPKRKKGKS